MAYGLVPAAVNLESHELAFCERWLRFLECTWADKPVDEVTLKFATALLVFFCRHAEMHLCLVLIC